MRTPHPLIAKLEREIALTDADRLSVSEVPFYVETLKAGEGPSWAGDRPTRCFVILECPGSALMRQTGVFCERRMSGSSQPPRSEDEADIRANQEGSC